MRIGLVCGSLSEPSANAAILRVAAAHLRAPGHVVTTIDGREAIPPFNPQLNDHLPAEVEAFCGQLRVCDAVLIAAPEYAGGVAGSMKNALDWLVSDATIYREVIGVASAGTTGGFHAIEQLVRTISWQGGYVVATLSVEAPRTKSDPDGTLTDDATLSEIGVWVDTVVDATEGPASLRRELVSAVVVRFNIDPARFGDIE